VNWEEDEFIPELAWELDQLPKDDEERDRTKLQFHFRTWGMQRLPRTRYMVSSPAALSPVPADSWPPCVILTQWNTCAACGGYLDQEREEWTRSPDGPVHRRCYGPDA
jgi:hypothetical protein